MEGLSGAGLYLKHKAAGPTSYSVVEEAKARLAPRLPLCHGGALDPFASGLMLVLAGPATKLFPYLHALPKTYRATVAWGVETDNLDPLGKPVKTGDASGLTSKAIEAALTAQLGWQEQVPPRHSNKRVKGERAWKKAQRGEAFELPPSRVYLHTAKVLSHALPGSTALELTCRGGYYVRALARELGRALGCPAHLSSLERTRIGPWADVEEDGWAQVPRDELLGWAPTRVLNDDERGRLRRKEAVEPGKLEAPRWRLPPGFPDAQAPVRGVHLGKLAVLLRSREGALWPEVELTPPL